LEIIAPIDTPFGKVAIAWTASDITSSITRIDLPGELRDVSPPTGTLPFPSARLEQLALQIRQFLSGGAVDFALEGFDMSGMSPFQRKVLLLCRRIPRGKVSTYGGLAGRLLIPRAARAVGTALARNPFPLVIPCHRVVRSGGDTGNFGGGRPMKKTLLQMEGVHFDTSGKVLREYFW
jgi:methylated-DNA-[protein]-cysteine S-methyltransferase